MAALASADLPIAGVFAGSPRVARHNSRYAPDVFEDRLHAPEAAARQHRRGLAPGMAAWMAAWKDRCLGGGVDAGWAMGLRLRLLNPCRQRRLKQQEGDCPAKPLSGA